MGCAMKPIPTAHVPASWHGEVQIPIESLTLDGNLDVPARAVGLVIFVHGSGSSRHSSRNRRVASMLEERGMATLLFDLLTKAEEREDALTAHLRFDIGMLAARLRLVTLWASKDNRTAGLRVGYFGASTGGGAALVAAAADPSDRIGAVVSRGGRPDLAGEALPLVQVPTLLIVGGNDGPVIPLNEKAQARLRCENRLEIIPGATHLFEEPGALERVAALAGDWFVKHLPQTNWHP